MSEKVQVEAFQCSCCKRAHFAEDSADRCCSCPECGTKGNTPGTFRNNCDKCQRKIDRKRTREAIYSIKRAIEQERSRHTDRLERLQADLVRMQAALETS